MSLRSHTKLDQVEGRNAVRAEDALHLAGIVERGGVSIGTVRGHAMHLRGRNGRARQQRLHRQVIAALRVIRWHAAFVTPEDLYPRPIERVAILLASQQRIRLLRRVTSRQGNRETAARHNSFVGEPRDIPRGLLANGGEVGINSDMHTLTLSILYSLCSY